jgi:AsmA family
VSRLAAQRVARFAYGARTIDIIKWFLCDLQENGHVGFAIPLPAAPSLARPRVESSATSFVRPFRRRIIQAAVAVVAVFLLIGIIVPFINAAAFGAQIQGALQSALGRKVQIGKVHFTLLTGPGFQLEEVNIAEDPRFGLEPFAYVETLDVRVRPDKLLFGRIQISSLRLNRPSLNFAKQADGTWNFVELIDRFSSPRRAPLSFFPTVELTGARIDFKLGVRKTTLYLADTDLDLYPERSGRLSIRFAGSPSRTDRSGVGFGHFRGSASWLVNLNDANSNALQADITLDPSNLSELTTLFEGYDIGIHGTVGLRAHLEGPATALGLTGELDLGDVHRWDLLPKPGESWRIGYRGTLDLPQQRFDLVTLPSSGKRTPVTLQVRVNQFLAQPSWSVLARLDKAPAGNLLPLAQRLGVQTPAGLELAGSLDGVVGYSNRAGLDGGVTLNDASITLPGVPALHATQVATTISNGKIHLDPVVIEASGQRILEASADYFPDTRNVELTASAERGDVAVLTKVLRAWFSDSPVVLSSFDGGLVTGQVRYAHVSPDEPVWNGQFQMVGGKLQADGLAAPVTDVNARLNFDESGLDVTRLSATANGVPFHGEYHYAVKGVHHERLRLEIDVLDLDQAEALLDPSLRSSGLLARLRGRRQLPPWLANRSLEGDIAVNRAAIDGFAVGGLRTHFTWDAAVVQISSLQVSLEQGSIRAKGSVNLTENNPRYRLSGEAMGLPWKGGKVDISGHLDTAGSGRETLRNLRSSGTFTAEDLSLTSEVDFSKLTGKYQMSFEAGWPSVRLASLQASQGEEQWDGEAASQRDGKLIFELANGRRQLHVVSTLLPSPAESAGIRPSETRPAKTARQKTARSQISLR